jgi:exodeoxyribonuclease-3
MPTGGETPDVRVATWNINSLRARLERVEAWLAEVEPDVVLLQETKLADDAFPALTFEALGYSCAHHGQGQWNGVAILSRVGLDDVIAGFADGGPPDGDARLVSATCGDVRVSSAYVPNGRSLDDDHYRYKLDWLDRLAAHLDTEAASNDSIIIGGDFNIAPEDRDVHDPEKFVGATHVSDAERERLSALVDRGLVDVFRRHHADDRVFSWWDYRAGDFHQGRGMRIDLLMCSEPVVERSAWCLIDRNARKGKQPSDHAPVIVELRD